MRSPHAARPNTVRAVVALGFLLNLLGWLGNAFLLREEWRAALAGALTRPRVRGPVGEVLTLLPDFVYAAAWVWLYMRLAPVPAERVRVALKAGLVVWAVGAATTYFGIANSGLLPARIAALGTGLALVTFAITAPLLPRLIGARPDGELAVSQARRMLS